MNSPIRNTRKAIVTIIEGDPRIETRTMLITPAIARKMLLHNGISPDQPNRHLRKTHVAFLAGMMLRGEWQLTHQGIAITRDGWLLDGQHRLYAIIESGVSVRMNVTQGLSREAYDAIDIGGSARTLADVLHARNNDVAVATLAYRLANGVGSGRSFSAVQMRPYVEVFAPLVEELTRDGGTEGTKRLLNAHVRLAGILAAECGDGYDYVRPLYKALVQRDYPNLPPAALSLIRRVDMGDIRRGVDSPDLLVYTRMAFTRSKANLSKLLIKNMPARREAAAAEVQQIMRAYGEEA